MTNYLGFDEREIAIAGSGLVLFWIATHVFVGKRTVMFRPMI